MSAMASQITSLAIVYSTVCSRRRSKKAPKPRDTGLYAGSSTVTCEFLAQRTSNAESVSIRWRHHVQERYIAANKLLYLAFVDNGKSFGRVPCTEEGPRVWLKGPRGRGMCCECHPGHVLQCLVSCVGKWSVHWGVGRGSWCASGLCP